MTRLPGFLNRKWTPVCRVTVEYGSVDAIRTPADFPMPPSLKPQHDAKTRFARPATGEAHVLERARRYVRSVPPAVTGQGGDVHTFRVCCRLVRGFALSDQDALIVLRDWNARCDPPWSERQLMDKLRHARRYGREPIGGLLETQR
jgi:hypothetical protein